MQNKYLRLLSLLLIVLLIPLAYWLRPGKFEAADLSPPPTRPIAASRPSGFESPCKDEHPEWRQAQVIDGVEIAESLACSPDNPYDVAAFVKGVNNVSMPTLMNTHLSEDALTKTDDLDGDGDPDVIRIKLEVIELNGRSPDGDFLIPSYDILPGVQPGLWVFAPKTSDMAVKNYGSNQANYFLRAPSPVIRVEQGDQVYITLENTHYFPHTIHFHGVDHPWKTADGGDNDGAAHGGADHVSVFPGDSHTYEMKPRTAGTMLYHCHVQTDRHFMMGMAGMFIVEENRPNNWVQTFNIGGGQVRHPSIGVKEEYNQEYDLHYQSVDKRLAKIIQEANDPRLIEKKMNREYNMTESHESYFLLNGHAFPYTLRDDLIVTGPNEKIKLRVANAQDSAVALHFHGHRATITHYDGIEQPEATQVIRDVVDIASAQRVDIKLDTTNDGLHNDGEGVWMFHDHVETGTTNDGVSPGGNMSLVVYRDYIDEKGMPKLHDGAFDQFFTRSYYEREQPMWAVGEFAQLLGEAGLLAPNYLKITAFGLTVGLLFALVFYLVRGFKKGAAE